MSLAIQGRIQAASSAVALQDEETWLDRVMWHLPLLFGGHIMWIFGYKFMPLGIFIPMINFSGQVLDSFPTLQPIDS